MLEELAALYFMTLQCGCEKQKCKRIKGDSSGSEYFDPRVEKEMVPRGAISRVAPKPFSYRLC